MKPTNLLFTGLALLTAVCGNTAMQQKEEQFVSPCWSTDAYKITQFKKIQHSLHSSHDWYTKFEFKSEKFIFDNSGNLHFNINLTASAPRCKKNFGGVDSLCEPLWLSLDITTGEYQHHGGHIRTDQVFVYVSHSTRVINAVPCKQIFDDTVFKKCIPLKYIPSVTRENFSGACTTPNDKALFVFLKDGTILKVIPVRAPKTSDKFADIIITMQN
jgi:hypothetical protein